MCGLARNDTKTQANQFINSTRFDVGILQFAYAELLSYLNHFMASTTRFSPDRSL